MNKKKPAKSFAHLALRKLKHWPIYDSRGELIGYKNLVSKSFQGKDFSLQNKEFKPEVIDLIKEVYLTAAQISARAYQYVEVDSKKHLETLRDYAGYEDYEATKYIKGVFVPVLYGEKSKVSVTPRGDVKISNRHYDRTLLAFKPEDIIDEAFIESLKDQLTETFGKNIKNMFFTIQVGAFETVNVGNFLHFPGIVDELQRMVLKYIRSNKDMNFIKGIVAYDFFEQEKDFYETIGEHNDVRYVMAKARKRDYDERKNERRKLLRDHINKYGEFTKEELARFNAGYIGTIRGGFKGKKRGK